MAIHLGRPLPDASRDLPRQQHENMLFRSKPKLLPLFGLAPGVVYPATPVAGGAVRSYRTLSPLPALTLCYFDWRFTFCGTFPEVTPAGCYPAPCFRGARTFLPLD